MQNEGRGFTTWHLLQQYCFEVLPCIPCPACPLGLWDRALSLGKKYRARAEWLSQYSYRTILLWHHSPTKLPPCLTPTGNTPVSSSCWSVPLPSGASRSAAALSCPDSLGPWSSACPAPPGSWREGAACSAGPGGLGWLQTLMAWPFFSAALSFLMTQSSWICLESFHLYSFLQIGQSRYRTEIAAWGPGKVVLVVCWCSCCSRAPVTLQDESSDQATAAALFAQPWCSPAPSLEPPWPWSP